MNIPFSKVFSIPLLQPWNYSIENRPQTPKGMWKHENKNEEGDSILISIEDALVNASEHPPKVHTNYDYSYCQNCILYTYPHVYKLLKTTPRMLVRREGNLLLEFNFRSIYTIGCGHTDVWDEENEEIYHEDDHKLL